MEDLALLELMESKWMKLDLAKRFSAVHHFASDKFSSQPSGLVGFCNWYRARTIEVENIQTIRRALAVACLVEGGARFEAAREIAWLDFPVLLR